VKNATRPKIRPCFVAIFHYREKRVETGMLLPKRCLFTPFSDNSLDSHSFPLFFQWCLHPFCRLFSVGKPSQATITQQVYYKTLNLILSASKKNIKNLVGNFAAIHVGIMRAKFQPSCLNGVEGGGGDR